MQSDGTNLPAACPHCGSSNGFTFADDLIWPEWVCDDCFASIDMAAPSCPDCGEAPQWRPGLGLKCSGPDCPRHGCYIDAENWAAWRAPHRKGEG